MLGMIDQIARDHLSRVKVKDRYISAACPFHNNGQERHPSFWVDRTKGNWGCFTCPAKGSSLKKLLELLKVGGPKILAILEEAEKDSKKTFKLEKAKLEKKARADFKGTHILPDAILGVFDHCPVSLVEQGFSEELLLEHEIGFDHRNNRITFPVRDIYGNLVGINGRSTTPGEVPKYLFYSGQRMSNGKKTMGELGEWYPDYSNEDVRNHLWRCHALYQPLFDSNHAQLIIVEGYKAAMWVAQYGWNVVATMGTKMTLAQERIIRQLGAEVFVFQTIMNLVEMQPVNGVRG
jgi:DNA primase